MSKIIITLDKHILAFYHIDDFDAFLFELDLEFAYE